MYKVETYRINTSKMAKFLLKYECRVIDIQPHKDNQLKTSFIFENTPDLWKAIKIYKETIAVQK